MRIVDGHRGVAYKKWFGDGKHLTGKLINYLAHIVAMMKRIYSYDTELDNREYVIKTMNAG
jgi:hypothetical protein